MDELAKDLKALLEKHSAKIEVINEEGLMSILLRTSDGFFHTIDSGYNHIIIDKFTILI